MNKVSASRQKPITILQPSTQNPQVLLMPTHSYDLTNAPPSMNQLRKIIKQLQLQLRNQREMRKQIQQNFKIFQKRSILRQKQFHSILQVSSKQVKMFKTGQNQVQCIKKTYEDIFKNFQNNNDAMNQLIQKKYKQNLYTMERKVASILQIFNSQLAKNKKVSSQSVRQIKLVIQKALMMVQSVQDQNVQLRINLKNQKYRTKLMHQQRKLLLQQMMSRKLKISKLLLQNKKYKQLLDLQSPQKLSKDHQHSKIFNKLKQHQQTTDANQNGKLNTLSSTFWQFQSKQHPKFSNAKFLQELTQNPENQQYRQKSDCSPDVSRQSSASRLPNQKLPKNNLTFYCQGTPNTHKNQIKFINKSKKYAVKSQCKNSFDLSSKPPNHFTSAIGKANTGTSSFNDCTDTQKPYNINNKVIQHLKLCLQRQRKKVSELSKLVSKFQGRNQQVNEAILQALSKTKQKSGKDTNNNLQTLLKSEKLLQIIADMKKRLAMCEKPTVGSGWGEADLQLFLQH